jgi:rod shape-determining protein MreD
VRPDLVLDTVVIWAVTRGAREALPWGLMGGLMLDLVSGTPFGTLSLVLVIVAFLSSAGDINLFPNALWLPMVTVFVATFVHAIILLIVLRSLGIPNDWWLDTLRTVTAPTAVVNVVTTPLVYWVVRKFTDNDRSRIQMRFGRL